MEENKKFLNDLHKTGRTFTLIALLMIVSVPIVYCFAAKVLPDFGAIGKSFPFILSYIAIGLMEAISYAPLLGIGGQYLSFITGNISNLKLPCALNAQNITKTVQGSEEQEIVTTISIAVSSIVTTVIIALGLIPLFLFNEQIVSVLAPVSPYIIPAIFGGLGVVLLSKYFKVIIIPFVIMLTIAIVTFAMGMDLGQSTMIPIGMAVSLICVFISQKKAKKQKNK